MSFESPPATAALSILRRSRRRGQNLARGRRGAAVRGLGLAIAIAIGAPACRRASSAASSASAASAGEISQATGTPLRRFDPPRAASRSGGPVYPFTPSERAAVDAFLRRNPALRIATDDDRRKGTDSDAELRGLYGVYHPYFVRGDLDDDGILDFVLAFVRRDSGKGMPWFSVVVFTGTAKAGAAPGFSEGTVLERDVTLARGDMAVDRDAVVITPDLDEDDVRRYRWDPIGRTFVFVRDDEEGTETPEVSRTSRPAASRSPRFAAGAI